MQDKQVEPNPSGLCMCGCGRKSKVVTKSDRRHGHVMGQPFRFIHGHSSAPAKGSNSFKLRGGTAVIFLERQNGTVLFGLFEEHAIPLVSHFRKGALGTCASGERESQF